MQTLEYKSYIGTIEPDLSEGMLYGKVVNIDGALTYEGTTLAELEQSMHDAVDEYLDLCAKQGIEPRTPFNGDLRLRMTPDLHARIAAVARSTGQSMNQVVINTLADRLTG